MRTIRQKVKSFILARVADGRASRTVRDYHRVLEPFAAWCSGEGFDLTTLDRDAVRRYVVSLRERGWAEGTVAIHIRNIRTFLRWCYEEGYAATNLATAVKSPRRVIRVESSLTPAEVLALMDACQGDRLAARDKAIVLTFVDTGLRRSEIASLKRSDVHFEGETAWLQVYAHKTYTYRFAFLQTEATAALQAYLGTRTDDDEALWMGMRGPLAADGIYQVLRRRAIQAGIDPGRTHPHAFRKFFATQWVESGGDTTRLMWLGGWASMDMLEVYVLLSRKRDLAAAHRQFGPADRLLEDSE